MPLNWCETGTGTDRIDLGAGGKGGEGAQISPKYALLKPSWGLFRAYSGSLPPPSGGPHDDQEVPQLSGSNQSEIPKRIEAAPPKVGLKTPQNVPRGSALGKLGHPLLLG